MFWVWRAGYKFLRVDWMVTTASVAVPRWNVHLGSTGCESPDPAVAPSAECLRSNRPQVELSSYTLGDTIDIDFGMLVENADLSSNVTDSPPGCMSNPMETDDCNTVYGSLGLEFSTGSCAGGACTTQVFKVAP